MPYFSNLYKSYKLGELFTVKIKNNDKGTLVNFFTIILLWLSKFQGFFQYYINFSNFLKNIVFLKKIKKNLYINGILVGYLTKILDYSKYTIIILCIFRKVFSQYTINILVYFNFFLKNVVFFNFFFI